MKTTIYFNLSRSQNLLASILFMYLLSGCGFPPNNSTFESARTLGRGNVEVSGHYSKYSYQSSQFNTTDFSSYDKTIEFENYGYRIGLGITDNFDLKTRYERIMRNGEGINYLEISPKFSTSKNKGAFLIPLGVYFSGEGNNTYVLSPKFIHTYSSSNNSDFSFCTKADIFLTKSHTILLGINLGAGFSSDLSKWAIRPELGLMFNPIHPEPIWTYGLGFNYTISK
jgi:hypothetical protein